ncbi:MAG: hypothetical protein JWR83_539 [Aeromicrobium sp.]|nr:hypothetical protein [Aeromicrobium sp.]
MGCCIVAALIISGVRKAYFAVFPGRKPEVVAFAPAARRPGPGSSPQAIPVPDALRTALPTGLVAIAASIAVYVTVVAALRHAGTLAVSPSPLLGWTSRDLVMAAALAGVLLIALSGRRPVRGPVDEWSAALTALGASWTALAVFDMHVFGLFELSTMGDIAFHGVGLAALFVGLALHQPPSRSRIRTTAPLIQGVPR